MIDYKVLAQPSAIQSGDTRDNVYYPQIVNLSTMNTRALVQAMMNMGSSAFSMGEYLGIASDLGGAIAQMLITGHKIYLEGLGTFTPKVITTQKNVKESSAVNSSSFSCDVVFTAADEFINILKTAEWNRVQAVDPGQSSSTAFTVAVTSPAGNTLKFTPSKAGALQGFPKTGESISIDGTTVGASNIRYDAASGNVYVYNVDPGKHTVSLTVGTSRGFEAYSNTWQNVNVANAASLLIYSIYNGDDEEQGLRISSSSFAPPLEGGEEKKLSVESGQEIALNTYMVNIEQGSTYKLKLKGQHYDDDGTEGVEFFNGVDWARCSVDYVDTGLTLNPGGSSQIKIRANIKAQFALTVEPA